MNSGTRLRIRFAVGQGDSRFSEIWFASSHKDDVYVGASSAGRMEKISLHKSGICRYAFTDQFGNPWVCLTVPPSSGADYRHLRPGQVRAAA